MHTQDGNGGIPLPLLSFIVPTSKDGRNGTMILPHTEHCNFISVTLISLPYPLMPPKFWYDTTIGNYGQL